MRLYPAHLEALKTRHDHALERAGASHIVIYSGNSRVAFQDDYRMPFKANPHFVSWVPLTDVPFSFLVYSPGEAPRLIYFQPRDYWHVVPGVPSGYWTGQYEICLVHNFDEVAAHLPQEREKMHPDRRV